MDDKANEGAAPSGNMTGGIVTEFHQRLSALEAANSELQARLDAAQSSMEVQPYDGFGAHVVHVMHKHFFHDKPDAK